MGRSCFLRFLLVAALLLLSFSHGFGREVMESVEHGESIVEVEETAGISREMIEVMDYEEPGPNTNPKTGYIINPPPQA